MSDRVDSCNATGPPRGALGGKVVKENPPSGLNAKCYIWLAALPGLGDVQSANLHEFRDGWSTGYRFGYMVCNVERTGT